MKDIVETEGVIGGKPRLDGTRISVLGIAERVIDEGQDPSYVSDQLDIEIADVYNALAYYYDNIERMKELREQQKQIEERIEEISVEPPKEAQK